MRPPLTFYLEQNYPYTVVPDPSGSFFVSYPDLPGCITQVETSEAIGPAAEEIRTLWLETAYDHEMEIPLPRGGEGFSGKFLVRVPRSLHRRLAQSAEMDGVSLNQYVVALLATNDAIARVERRLDEAQRQPSPAETPGRFPREAEGRRATLSVVGGENRNP